MSWQDLKLNMPKTNYNYLSTSSITLTYTSPNFPTSMNTVTIMPLLKFWSDDWFCSLSHLLVRFHLHKHSSKLSFLFPPQLPQFQIYHLLLDNYKSFLTLLPGSSFYPSTIWPSTFTTTPVTLRKPLCAFTLPSDSFQPSFLAPLLYKLTLVYPESTTTLLHVHHVPENSDSLSPP